MVEYGIPVILLLGQERIYFISNIIKSKYENIFRGITAACISLVIHFKGVMLLACCFKYVP